MRQVRKLADVRKRVRLREIGGEASASKQPPGQPSATNIRTIRKLRKPANRSKYTRRLALKLDGCTVSTPCSGSACVKCHKRATEATSSAVSAFYANRGFVITERPPAECTKMKHHYFRDPNGRELALVTIVPLSRILVGELLDSEKPQQFLDKLEAVLKTSGAKSAIFCLDISTHESKARDFRPHYKVHAHGFMFRDEFECAENALRAAFPNKGNVKRSVHHEVYDGNPRAIRYMLEIPKERSIQLKAPLKTRHWKVSNRLRSAQEVELLQWLDQIGLSSRMLVFGPGTEVLQNLWTKPQQKVTRN